MSCPHLTRHFNPIPVRLASQALVLPLASRFVSFIPYVPAVTAEITPLHISTFSALEQPVETVSPCVPSPNPQTFAFSSVPTLPSAKAWL